MVGGEFEGALPAAVLEGDRRGEKWGELGGFANGWVVGQASCLPWGIHHRRDACATFSAVIDRRYRGVACATGAAWVGGLGEKDRHYHCGKKQEGNEPGFFHFS